MKRSLIWKPTKEEFQQIVNQQTSLAEILRYFGLHTGAGNYKTLKKRLKEESINTNHIQLGLSSNKGRSFYKLSKADILSIHFVQGSKTTTHKLKDYAFRHGLLENKCSECGQLSEWNGKPLVLHLDHINGDSSDNKLENLRILCPHCHSQTPTFAGRRQKVHYNCVDCHRSVSKGSMRCKSCAKNDPKKQPTKIDWPTREYLLKLTNEIGFSLAGRKLGVSDNAIRKHLKNTQRKD
jgi:Zn finger protein HypA/HybF involved in hydrogenase expression